MPTLSTSSEYTEDNDDLDIIEDGEGAQPHETERASWRILVVDDDPEVHTVTRFALDRSIIVGKTLDLISVFSASDARAALKRDPDIAVILLDVVMEAHDAGLKFVEWVRAQGYREQRIILRTGQPGYAPELNVVRDYDINDYRTKTELTQTRLITAMTAAIRTFEQFRLVDRKRIELEDFAYALGHDFKQTTRQIKTYSDLVVDSLSGTQQNREAQMLTYLSNASRRLSALVDVMSQYTLLSRETPIEEVDLAEVLAEVRVAIEPIVTERGGALKLDGQGLCRGNRVMIGQVLQILIANGFQHNDSDVPRVDVEVGMEGDHFVIAVRDNGVGIDDEHLEQVFEPRMRLRSSSVLSGTGLGLTLSRRAIEAQGGTLWCESGTGAGSTFFVRLPTGARVRQAAAI